MKSFDFVNVKTLDEALTLLSNKGSKAHITAGTTHVMIEIRSQRLNDRILVNIRDIEELRGISLKNDLITIGALTPISSIAESDMLHKNAPALWMAANMFADPTTRNSATIGGNIACSSPAADTAPPLLALDAEVIIAKKDSQRRVPIHNFFIHVNKNVLEFDELITAFEFKTQPKSGFYKLGLRNAMAISIATAAASVELNDKSEFKTVRIAMGSVAPTPLRCRTVEKILAGKQLGKEIYSAMAAALNEDISPIDDLRASACYRKDVAPVCVSRAIELALFGEFKCGGE